MENKLPKTIIHGKMYNLEKMSKEELKKLREELELEEKEILAKIDENLKH